ncbi:NAD(P)H-binding protein [Arthrobacter sp. Sa2BUA2]|uniref:NAD(P)H-binding protein n=1 Tax=Arthrobacter pullicola TaxID=2762224 RepID=A0ABR8YL30_9MICC|nr:NAD(P)H-binding protein [Arthrobacter pullicola]MBD8044939.1 NAD(P)H-binding protein [Arthrobacter pullicola]
MKIAVYGATGMVGSQIAAEALRRGHDVTAVSRRVSEVPGALSRQADLADAETFAEIAGAHDVVVLATGPSRTGGDHSEWLEAMKQAYASAGSTRLLVVGGAGALEIDGKRLVDTDGFPEEYRAEALTLAEAHEAILAAPAELDWTMLAAAPEIAPGERTGVYVTAKDSPAGDRISTQDYAVAMLDEIDRPAHRKERFTAAN